MEALRRLIREIHRRSLWQVLSIYVVGSWVVLQVAGELTDATSLPEWFPTLALGLLIVGLPVVLATAFVQERGPGGAPEDPPAGPARVESGARGLLTWRNALTGGVLAFALLGVLAAGWLVLGIGSPGGRASGDVEPSVAVLPFANMSGNPDNEYFSDGITEEILNALAQLPDLSVRAPTSSFAFKGRNIPIPQIAESLDVTHVVAGSVRRERDRVRITAQLVDARADTHLWSKTYERELIDVFAIQTEISVDIAGELRVELGGTPGPPSPAPTGSVEAHDLYLRGRYELNRRNITEAIGYFDLAIEEDPEYANAYGGLALAGVLASSYGASAPGLVDRALAAADRALELDPTLSEPHTARGNLPNRIGGLRASEEELRLALRLDPNDANAHQFLARALMGLGEEEEAVQSATRAILLDPSNVAHLWTRAMLYLVQGRVDEAEPDVREALRREPDNSFASGILATVLTATGRPEELRSLALTPSRLLPLLADSTTRDQGREILRSGSAAYPAPQAALLCGLFGEYEAALPYLERTLTGATPSNRGFTTYIFARARLLEPLRSDPRYLALMEQIGVAFD